LTEKRQKKKQTDFPERFFEASRGRKDGEKEQEFWELGGIGGLE